MIYQNCRNPKSSKFQHIKYPVARKDHLCEICHEEIYQGEVYCKVVGKDSGIFYCQKTHCNCQN
jgi:hypothetical protein